MDNKRNTYLLTALDIEDKMSKEVYSQYLDRNLWPQELPPEIFDQIKELIVKIINETDNHIEIFKQLKGEEK